MRSKTDNRLRFQETDSESEASQLFKVNIICCNATFIPDPQLLVHTAQHATTVERRGGDKALS